MINVRTVYSHDGGADGADRSRGGGEDLDVGLVSEAISSLRFWGCCACVANLSAPLDALMHWSEACDCHSAGATDLIASRRLSGVEAALLDAARRPCPLAGIRGSAMAAGELERLAERALERACLLLYADVADQGEGDRDKLATSTLARIV